ncbi:hypothetical protein [Oceanicoccus sp. KOV_DT_Chl]|uniref:hypothetical protein n=1 Tax=Oceanicoccus sp. KOV_DT_Chl TaxID=1904639 RepID=UPI000C7A2853|nr:hypothetical protein [Oceanicoccus sp. KOV_DT_Chl]
MDNLATYNRVPSLESKTIKASFILVYSLLLLAIIGSLAATLVFPDISHYLISGAIAATILYSAIAYLDARRKRHCQFCKQTLSSVIRPLLLNSQYLNMQGKKHGDYFITHGSWGLIPFKKRWVKISNHSMSCHHCRLIEEGYKPMYQPLSPEELAKFQSK